MICNAIASYVIALNSGSLLDQSFRSLAMRNAAVLRIIGGVGGSGALLNEYHLVRR